MLTAQAGWPDDFNNRLNCPSCCLNDKFPGIFGMLMDSSDSNFAIGIVSLFFGTSYCLARNSMLPQIDPKGMY